MLNFDLVATPVEKASIGEILTTIYSQYLLVTIAVIILGIFLSKWEPPIKKQYIFLILATASILTCYFIVDATSTGVIYGFIVAGLVFYKDTLVEEIKLIISISKHINKEKEVEAEARRKNEEGESE